MRIKVKKRNKLVMQGKGNGGTLPKRAFAASPWRLVLRAEESTVYRVDRALRSPTLRSLPNRRRFVHGAGPPFLQQVANAAPLLGWNVHLVSQNGAVCARRSTVRSRSNLGSG